MKSHTIVTDHSPEAIKSFLTSHTALIVRYIKLRTDQKGGIENLFECDGGDRFVLNAKETDSEDTKQLVKELTTVLSNELVQADIKDSVSKWTPRLQAEDINAAIVRVTLRYFTPVKQSNEWHDFIASYSNPKKTIIDQIANAFCYWIVLLYSKNISANESGSLLTKKVNLLVKLLNNTNNIADFIVEEKSAFHAKLIRELDNIEVTVKSEKKFKKQLDKFHTLLEANFQQLLSENWLPRELKVNIAIEAIDHFMKNIKNNDKLKDKHKNILEELYKHIKVFMEKSAVNDLPKGFENAASPSSTPSTLFTTPRNRSLSAPQAAVIHEFRMRKNSGGDNQ